MRPLNLHVFGLLFVAAGNFASGAQSRIEAPKELGNPSLADLDRPVLHKRDHASQAPTGANGDGDASTAPIRPYSKNPSYWEYHGMPLLLLGGSDRDNIFQWALDGTKLRDHLELLASCGGNYIRCTMSSRVPCLPALQVFVFTDTRRPVQAVCAKDSG